jgi:hypothetical protein
LRTTDKFFKIPKTAIKATGQHPFFGTLPKDDYYPLLLHPTVTFLPFLIMACT